VRTRWRTTLGVSLCGPMVIADPITKTLATNQPPPSDPWPPGLGYVAAPMQWGGKRWAAYPWSYLVSDPQRRRRTLLHELFHRCRRT